MSDATVVEECQANHEQAIDEGTIESRVVPVAGQNDSYNTTHGYMTFVIRADTSTRIGHEEQIKCRGRFTTPTADLSARLVGTLNRPLLP